MAHPDAGGSHDEAMRVIQAKEILLDPKKRAAYHTVSFPKLRLIVLKALSRYRLKDGDRVSRVFDEEIENRIRKYQATVGGPNERFIEP